MSVHGLVRLVHFSEFTVFLELILTTATAILRGYCIWVIDSDGVKDMTHKAKAKAKAKDLTCHAALKPQTLYTVQCSYK